MSELFPAKSVAFEILSCTDPSQEGEFNRWYDKIHIPDLRAIPGIVDVYRYRDMQPDLKDMGARLSAPAGAPVRYLTVYRMNDADPWAVMRKVKENDARQAAAGHGIGCMKTYEVTVWDFVACRHSILPPLRHTNLPDGMPETILLLFGGHDHTKKLEHDDWWLYTHAHDLLETPGLVQCERYRNLNPAPSESEPDVCNVYEFDMDNPGAAMLKILEDDKYVRRVQGRFSSFSRSVKSYGTGLYQHWDLM